MLFKSDAFNKVEVNVKIFYEDKMVSQIRTYSALYFLRKQCLELNILYPRMNVKKTPLST